jgi:hypothetical protein
MHSGELIAFLHHVHHIIDGMHRALGDRFDSSVAFQTQYVRNKILSIAALDYKIRHGASREASTAVRIADLLRVGR